MGLILSNQQIANELDFQKDDIHRMTRELHQAIMDQQPEVSRPGQVEFDEEAIEHYPLLDPKIQIEPLWKTYF